MAGMITAAPYQNGRLSLKAEGDTVYRGILEQLPPPQPITSVEEAADRMFSDGFIQFPDLFSPAEVAKIRTWMDGLGKPDSAYEMKDWCFNKDVMADLEHDPMWLSLMDRAPVYDVLTKLLGARIYLNWAKIWVTGKGRAMGIHLDHMDVVLPEDILMDPRVRVPIFDTTLHLYFDDQVEEIGPTLVIPGSHRAGRPPSNESTWHGIAPKMVSVKAGGAVLFRHDLWHGAAMNTSSRRRYLIQLRYVEARDRQYRHRHCSPAVLAAGTPRQLSLIGQPSQREAEAASMAMRMQGG
jgi:hypothetical protein